MIGYRYILVSSSVMMGILERQINLFFYINQSNVQTILMIWLILANVQRLSEFTSESCPTLEFFYVFLHLQKIWSWSVVAILNSSKKLL